MNYTKGPWLVDSVLTNSDIILGYDIPGAGSPILVASAYDDEDQSKHVQVVIDSKQAHANARLMAASPRMADAIEATLLFHSPTPWSNEKRNRWTELTGTPDATSKNLCDFLRKVQAESKGQS